MIRGRLATANGGRRSAGTATCPSVRGHDALPLRPLPVCRRRLGVRLPLRPPLRDCRRPRRHVRQECRPASHRGVCAPCCCRCCLMFAAPSFSLTQDVSAARQAQPVAAYGRKKHLPGTMFTLDSGLKCVRCASPNSSSPACPPRSHSWLTWSSAASCGSIPRPTSAHATTGRATSFYLTYTSLCHQDPAGRHHVRPRRLAPKLGPPAWRLLRRRE